jgi:RHS repeat-associated protein
LDQNGGLISYEEYHPYGSTAYQAMSSAAEVSLKRYRYTGHERDEETGLSYHRARYYAPWLARWISADPAGVIDGPNLYRYVRNNPLALVDHNGKDPALPNDTRTNEERNLSYSDPAAAAAAYKMLEEQERKALRDRVYGTTPKDPGAKRERPSVTLVDAARALAPTTFQAIKPSERLKDAPPGIRQMYGGASQDDIATRGANVAKKIVEYGGTAGLIAGDIGLAGVQIGYSTVRSTVARSVEKEVVTETLGKTAEKHVVDTAVKLVPKPKTGLDAAVGEGVAVAAVRLKIPAQAIVNRGGLAKGTVAVATHGAERVHIATGKAVRVLTGELADITEKQLVQIARAGVASLQKTGVQATRVELLVCGGANARLCSIVASKLGLPTVAHSGVIEATQGIIVRSGAKRVALPVLK